MEDYLSREDFLRGVDRNCLRSLVGSFVHLSPIINPLRESMIGVCSLVAYNRLSKRVVFRLSAFRRVDHNCIHSCVCAFVHFFVCSSSIIDWPLWLHNTLVLCVRVNQKQILKEGNIKIGDRKIHCSNRKMQHYHRLPIKLILH